MGYKICKIEKDDTGETVKGKMQSLAKYSAREGETVEYYVLVGKDKQYIADYLAALGGLFERLVIGVKDENTSLKSLLSTIAERGTIVITRNQTTKLEELARDGQLTLVTPTSEQVDQTTDEKFLSDKETELAY